MGGKGIGLNGRERDWIGLNGRERDWIGLNGRKWDWIWMGKGKGKGFGGKQRIRGAMGCGTGEEMGKDVRKGKRG